MTDDFDAVLKKSMGEEAYNDFMSALRQDPRGMRPVEEVLKDLPRVICDD